MVFQNKLLNFCVQASIFIFDFANLILSDILMYEVTEGVSFDYQAMLHNQWFWILLLIHFSHVMLMIIVKHKNSMNDHRVETAIEDQQVSLLKQIPKRSKKGEYEDAVQVLMLIDELEKRRHK